jgi:citrate/tricarballylate utilization protein
VVGGAGLIVGPLGLLWLHRARDRALVDEDQAGMDSGFLVLLLLVAVSGMALLAWRERSAMGLLLSIHLAAVLALFLTMPYGKFVHGIYRYAALVRNALERARPAPRFSSE